MFKYQMILYTDVCAPSELQGWYRMSKATCLQLIGKKDPHGFTLIELGVILAIVAILGSASLVRMSNFGLYVQSQKQVNDLQDLSESVRNFWLEHVQIDCVWEKGWCTSLRYSLDENDTAFSMAKPLVIDLSENLPQHLQDYLPTYLDPENVQDKAYRLILTPYLVRAEVCTPILFELNEAQVESLHADPCYGEDNGFRTMAHAIPTLSERMLRQLVRRMSYSFKRKNVSDNLQSS